MSNLRRTPLYDWHAKSNARFTGFGGWEMPVHYTSINEEHLAARTSAGLFDVSHMGEIVVSGRFALETLQRLTCNDVTKLTPGRAQYSLLLNPHSGVVDDIIIYQLNSSSYLICVNASNIEKDYNWIVENNGLAAEVEDHSLMWGQIAVQGPRAVEVLAGVIECRLEELSLSSFRPFDIRNVFVASSKRKVELFVARTGYTGEDGFELFVPAESVLTLWERFMEVGSPLGLLPIGLGARDTLRLEAGLPLYGHELRDNIPVLYSHVAWAVKLGKGEFIGREEALRSLAEPGFKLIGLEIVDAGIARDGMKIFSADREVGFVTSGTKTPYLQKAIALGYVQPALASEGSKLEVEVRGKRLSAVVTKIPFYKRSNN